MKQILIELLKILKQLPICIETDFRSIFIFQSRKLPFRQNMFEV